MVCGESCAKEPQVGAPSQRGTKWRGSCTTQVSPMPRIGSNSERQLLKPVFLHHREGEAPRKRILERNELSTSFHKLLQRKQSLSSNMSGGISLLAATSTAAPMLPPSCSIRVSGRRLLERGIGSIVFAVARNTNIVNDGISWSAGTACPGQFRVSSKSMGTMAICVCDVLPSIASP